MFEERAAKMKSWVPFLPDDLFFNVFLFLPIKSLLKFTCVCKTWYKMIHCAEFVESYNDHAETTPILFKIVVNERPNTFHVETQLELSKNFCFFPSSSGFERKKFIHFLEIENEKAKIIDLNISFSGSVVATCNGLILITSMYGVQKHWSHLLQEPLFGSRDKPGQLIVMNPMTRKLIGFPLGTLPHGLGRSKESYGFVYSHSKGVYKVVHLFKDKSGFIACEILSLQTRSWKAVDGPSGVVLSNLDHAPISAIGALHWLPCSDTNYIISMGVDDERFTIIDLPLNMCIHDRLIEMGGYLSFVKSLNMNHIEVWVLKELEGTEWVKQHTIRVDAILGYADIEEYSVPSFALNAKVLVFKRKEKLFSYDFELEEIREIEMEHESITAYETIMPHSCNLATWEPLEHMR